MGTHPIFESDFDCLTAMNNRRNEERLHDFLVKLPKAHRWAVHEFFYSDIDHAIFESESEFKLCLKETFPQLHGKRLRRVEWNMIRKLLGKPRRFSTSFLEEERDSLRAKRDKIRVLQRGGTLNADQLQDLPRNIPATLPVGTRVTCKVNLQPRSDDLLATGTVEVVVNKGYKIRFDSNVPELFQSGEPYFVSDLNVMSNEQIPSLVVEKPEQDDLADNAATMMPLINGLADLQVLLDEKERIVGLLHLTNNHAQAQFALGQHLSMSEKKEYAQNMVRLQQVNSRLEKVFGIVNSSSSSLKTKYPTEIETVEHACANAYDLVQQQNKRYPSDPNKPLKSESLIVHLTAILEELGKSNEANNGLIQDLIDSARQTTSPELATLFEQEVVQQVHHLRTALSTNILGCFSSSR